MTRRLILRLTAGAIALPALTRTVFAQAYPTRPLRLIVPFPPGGPTDLVARPLAQSLAERLGQPVVIENRGGAGATIGTEAAVRSPPDGYTLLMAASSSAIAATLYDKLSFNFIRDIAPVAGLVRFPQVLVVHPKVPAGTIPELIAYAKANPGRLNFASPGAGTGPHVSGELFKMLTGTDMVHVPYRGVAPALTDLIAGQVQVMFVVPVGLVEHIESGKLRALAVTTTTRSRLLPQLPTVSEVVPGYEASTWFGIGAPRNTPARHRRAAQPRDQCLPGRAHDKRAPCRSRRSDAHRYASGFREARRRRDREVGQGGEVRRHQGGVIGRAAN